MLEQHGATYSEQRVVRAGKIVTAAGVSSGIDMALHLAGELAGTEAAKAIQLAHYRDEQMEIKINAFFEPTALTAAYGGRDE